MEKQFKQIIEAIAEILRDQIEIQASKYALVDGGSLRSSDAIKEIDVRINGFNIDISAPGYVKYIQSGRRAGALKNVRIPIDAIIPWLKKKGISGDLNSIAFAIQTSIFKNGIKTATRPRPFLDDAIEETAKKAQDILRVDIEDIIKNILKDG